MFGNNVLNCNFNLKVKHGKLYTLNVYLVLCSEIIPLLRFIIIIIFFFRYCLKVQTQLLIIRKFIHR